MGRELVAVVLAAGRGTRLQTEAASIPRSPDGRLQPDQRRVADLGIKALMPIYRDHTASGRTSLLDTDEAARPFVAYNLDAMAHAGIERVCWVVRPDIHNPASVFPTHPKIRTQFAVQEQPRGTADAVASVRASVGADDLLVLNSDTYYPTALLQQLADAGAPALIALDGHAVGADPRSNLRAQQMAQWAALTVDDSGDLDRVLDPPLDPPAPPWWVNINAWRFDSRIFDACAALEAAELSRPSDDRRAELELPRAVELSRKQHGVRYRVLESSAPILDLTARADVQGVERLLPSLD